MSVSVERRANAYCKMSECDEILAIFSDFGSWMGHKFMRVPSSSSSSSNKCEGRLHADCENTHGKSDRSAACVELRDMKGTS